MEPGRYLSYSLLEKTADISRSRRPFLRKMKSEVRVQEFHTDDVFLRLRVSIWLLLFFGWKFASDNQKHNVNPDLSSDASSIWNFCARFSDVISRGNRWWRREMSAVFSGEKKKTISRGITQTCLPFLANWFYVLDVSMGEHNSRAQIAETIHRVLGNFLLFSQNCYSFEINATWWLNQVKHECFAERF